MLDERLQVTHALSCVFAYLIRYQSKDIIVCIPDPGHSLIANLISVQVKLDIRLHTY